ncbi:Transcriptional activator hac1 [Escovopsis weberi]|uniref:Transcriptional activator hac1 n=1 Tax=Escovopsis weberi TaxID=150374 RepID=A0A0N0RTI0_ESCWE|nr:Transcriptional activator hac1 [Escovopsis weberi]
MHPIEMMTPQSFTDEKQDPSRLSAIPETTEDAPPESTTAAAAADKKPTKKRKSWGQVLPEPKTNLPPRKRAKTEDEKEQRRVERVLRNRRAAQSSRERKRLEVEALEKRNKELEQLLINVQKTNLMLLEELNRVQRPSGVVTRSSSPLESLRESITLSQQLFSSEDGHQMDDIMRSGVSPSNNPPTVNPASLSPPLNPVPDCDEAQELEDESGEQAEDETMNDEVPLAAPKTPEPRASEVTTAVSSDSTQPFDDDYLVGDHSAGLAHHSDFDLFDIDEFLTDDANGAANDVMAASNFAIADRGSDLEIHDPETQISPEYLNQQPQPGASIDLPSREVLMTLMWALKVEERRVLRKQSAALGTERNTSENQLSKLNGAGKVAASG